MAFAFALASVNVNAQRVLIDFDNEQQSFGTCFGTGSPDGPECLDVIANPDASGINTSDSIGVFIEPAAGEPWMGMFFDIVNGGDVDLTTASGNTELCIDVWVENAVPVSLKAEKVVDGAAAVEFEAPGVTPSATSEWVTVCADMATFNDLANRFVLFFNIGEVPATETSYFFDNVVQPGVVSVGGLIEEKGLKIFPNPATYNLFFNTDGAAMSIVVSDVTGREMARYTNYTDNNISVSNLVPGMYVVTFIEEATGKFGSTKFWKK